MPLKLIKGRFRPLVGNPNNDLARFLADHLSLLSKLESKPVKLGTDTRAKKNAQLWLIFLLMVAAIFIAGCGIHLHRPEDAKLAQTASTAFTDAKLTEALKAEFDAAAEILNDEVVVIRRQSSARRDRLLSAIIGGNTSATSWGHIKWYFDKRIEELLGQKPPLSNELNKNLDMWIKARDNADERFNTLREAYLGYEVERLRTIGKIPRIPRIGAELSKSEKDTLSNDFDIYYRIYEEALTKYKEELIIANTPPSEKGIVGATVALWKDQEKKLSDGSDEVKAAKENLERLKKERDIKIAESKAPGKKADEVSNALKEAAGKTDEAGEILKGLLGLPHKEPAMLDKAPANGLTGTQKKIAGLEEIREEISKLLPDAANAFAGKKPESSDGETIKLLASLTAIRAGIDGAAYPRVSDLILESERLRIELDRLRGLMALEEERKTLLELQLSAFSREIKALRKATTVAEKAKNWDAISLEKEASKQEDGVRALAYIAESWSVGRTPAEEIDFLICGIDQRAALENSSAAFAQWSNLIGVPLSQLVAYHQSGIKSEDLAILVNAAGLTAISIGVNN